MSTSPFLRLLEDVLRDELLVMGLDYRAVVESIVEKREGGTFSIRFHGPRHDLDIVEPEKPPSRSTLAAHLRRKLAMALSRGDSLH